MSGHPNTEKNAAKALLTMWGEAIASNALAAFEDKFGSLEAHTPPRVAKRPLADTAVTDDDAILATACSDTEVAAEVQPFQGFEATELLR